MNTTVQRAATTREDLLSLRRQIERRWIKDVSDARSRQRAAARSALAGPRRRHGRPRGR